MGSFNSWSFASLRGPKHSILSAHDTTITTPAAIRPPITCSDASVSLYAGCTMSGKMKRLSSVEQARALSWRRAAAMAVPSCQPPTAPSTRWPCSLRRRQANRQPAQAGRSRTRLSCLPAQCNIRSDLGMPAHSQLRSQCQTRPRQLSSDVVRTRHCSLLVSGINRLHLAQQCRLLRGNIVALVTVPRQPS